MLLRWSRSKAYAMLKQSERWGTCTCKTDIVPCATIVLSCEMQGDPDEAEEWRQFLIALKNSFRAQAL